MKVKSIAIRKLREIRHLPDYPIDRNRLIALIRRCILDGMPVPEELRHTLEAAGFLLPALPVLQMPVESDIVNRLITFPLDFVIPCPARPPYDIILQSPIRLHTV